MKVQLSLSATKLRNIEAFGGGKSDPFAIVTLFPKEEGVSPIAVGKTEVIKNCLDPIWTKTFVFDYELGQPQRFAVSIYDHESSGNHNSMGSTMFEIGSILGSNGNIRAKELKKGGVIMAHIERFEDSGTLNFQIRGVRFTNTEGDGYFNKSDPFFEIQRKRNVLGGGYIWDALFRSNFVKDNLNPLWSEGFLPMSSFAGPKARIRIAIFDRDKDGSHDFMGATDPNISVDFLQSRIVEGGKGNIGGINMSQAISIFKDGKDTGKLFVIKAETSGVQEDVSEEDVPEEEEDPEADEEEEEIVVSMEEEIELAPIINDKPPPRPNFVDYISGGCELNVCVAIDFTGSNGNPLVPGTLHHWDNDSDNDYESAMKSICTILSKYDSNQMFPVWGFGAKFDGEVRHCFQCGENTEVEGVDGVIDAYHAVFQSGLIMSSPTDVTEVIQAAAEHATNLMNSAEEKKSQAYTILLILTDGSVSDVEKTAAVLDEVSEAPMSIVIVGVGEGEDFDDMAFLDDRKGAEGVRDIAQFVPFNEHRESPATLTAATLNEIPDQLVNYFLSRNIFPLDDSSGEGEVAIEPFDERDDVEIDVNFEEEEIVFNGFASDPPNVKDEQPEVPLKKRQIKEFTKKDRVGRRKGRGCRWST